MTPILLTVELNFNPVFGRSIASTGIDAVCSSRLS